MSKIKDAFITPEIGKSELFFASTPTGPNSDVEIAEIAFNGDPKFACHFNMELSDETKNKLMDAINDMLEHRSQDLLKPPCSIVVTEGDDINHVKVHIIFDSFNGIETKGEKK